MEKTSLVLDFECKGMHYKGWATPSDRMHKDGHAPSYTVVLNHVFFGDMSNSNGKWALDQQRPHELIDAVGEFLDSVLRKDENNYSKLDPQFKSRSKKAI